MNLSAEPVAELALAGGADGHAENGGAADDRGLSRRGETGFDDERDQRAEDGKIDDVAEISGRDQRDNPAMQRRYFRLIQSVADKGFDCLCHTPSLPYGRLSGSERGTVVGQAPTVNVDAAAAAPRHADAFTPSNCKMYNPALESVTYIRASASTKQSHDWITCGRFGRGSNMRSGGGGTK